MQTNLGKRLKSVRTNLESTSLEQGALTRDQVRAQATALAQKKKRMGSAKPIIHETRGGRSEAVKEKERQKQDEEVDDDDANDNEGDGDDDSEGEDDDNSEGEDDGEDEDEDNSEGKGEAEDEENSKGKAEGEGEDGEEDGDGSLDGENDKGGVCTGKPTQRLNVVLAPRPDQGMMSRDAKKKLKMLGNDWGNWLTCVLHWFRSQAFGSRPKAILTRWDVNLKSLRSVNQSTTAAFIRRRKGPEMIHLSSLTSLLGCCAVPKRRQQNQQTMQLNYFARI